MRPLAALFGLILAGLLGLALAGALAAAPPRFDPVDYYRQDAEIARLEAEAARHRAAAEMDATLHPLDLTLAAAWRVLPLVAVAGFLFTLGAWGSLALVRFHRERWPRADGLLPVEAGQLPAVAPQALGAFHGARQLEAARQPVPHTITYSPHATHAPRLDYRTHPGGAAVLPADEPARVVEAPSFAALLDAGRIGRGNPMLLGYDPAGAPLEGSWLDLYSCGVGGLSGSGKSWTAVFLAAQAALFGTRIVLLDPHASNAESLAARLGPLAPRFLCAPAESPREMGQAVELVAEELRRRKAGARGEPVLFIADEYSALQRGELADPLAALVEGLGQEGRKLGLYALVAGQVWTASRAGGTEVRDSLASAYVHRCRPAQARYLTGMTAADLPGDLLELPAGGAYLLSTAGDFRRVTIPRMAPADVARVAELAQAGGPATTGPAPRPLGFHAPAPAQAPAQARPGPGPDSGPARASASGSGIPPLDAEAARVLARFAAGATVHDLAVELGGDANPGSRKYKAARERVEALLRALAGRVAGNA